MTEVSSASRASTTGVNGTGKATVFAGLKMRFHETGKVYNYGLGMTLGVLLLIAAAVLLV